MGTSQQSYQGRLMSIMNRQSNRHLPLNPTEQIIGSWGLGKWIGASLIEYWNVLIRLLGVCLVCKVRLYTNQKQCQVPFVHGLPRLHPWSQQSSNPVGVNKFTVQ